MKLVLCILVATLSQCTLAKPSSVKVLRTDNNVEEATKLLTSHPRSPLRLDSGSNLTVSQQLALRSKDFGLTRAGGSNKQDDYQAVQLFTEHGQAGQVANLYAEYCGDLSRCFDVNFDNVVSSSRVFGIWLFYDGYGYGISDDLDVVWVWGDDFYYDFSVLDNAVSSVRFVGPELDFYGDSITLFSDENFKAWEYFIFGNSPSLPGWEYLTDSAIVTGSNSWTLFEFELFQGQSVCLSPGASQNPGLYPSAQSVGLNAVRSVRMGCVGNAVKQTPIGIKKNTVYSSQNY